MESVSLRTLGLTAPDGLDCPAGATHEISQPELQVAKGDVADHGIAHVRCVKCGALIELASLRELR